MTIETTTNSVTYTANGTTTAFDAAFLIPEDCLKVWLTTAGSIKEAASSSYTVSGEGTAATRVTFATAPASGVQVTLERAVPITQPTVFRTGNALYLEVLTSSLDRLTMIAQRLQESLARSLRLPVSDSSVAEFPPSSARAGRLLGFLDDGSLSVLAVPSSLESAVTAIAAMKTEIDAEIDALQDGLGTAAVANLGTSAGNVPVVGSDGKLPSVVLPSRQDGNILTYASPTAVTLSRHGGTAIPINGASVAIPASGVSLASTGLAAATLYYVYAYLSSGGLTLEASTTGHSMDDATGVEIKSGDASRTLVGMVYCKIAATFAPGLVRSWYNRDGFSNYGMFNSAKSTSVSSGITELASEIRAYFLSWPREVVNLSAYGATTNSSASSYTYTQLILDGANTGYVAEPFQTAGTGWYVSFNLFFPCIPGEGVHYLSLGAKVSGGTATFAYIGGGACGVIASTGS